MAMGQNAGTRLREYLAVAERWVPAFPYASRFCSVQSRDEAFPGLFSFCTFFGGFSRRMRCLGFLIFMKTTIQIFLCLEPESFLTKVWAIVSGYVGFGFFLQWWAAANSNAWFSTCIHENYSLREPVGQE